MVTCRRKRRLGSAETALQPKLRISRPGDALEQQADEVADRVVGLSDSAGNHGSVSQTRSLGSHPILQRQAAGADLDQAVFWWDKILEHEPENQSLWTRVGDALLNLDRLEEALTHYESSLKVGHDLFAVLGLARCEQKRGNLKKALKYCEQALAEDPDNHRVLQILSKIHEDSGNDEAAREALERIR